MKSSKYGENGSCDHLLFLFSKSAVVRLPVSVSGCSIQRKVKTIEIK